MPKAVSGEARVTYVTDRYAILSKAGLNGTVFVVPSSVLGQQHGYPSLKVLLNLNDVVKFSAEAQEERNGVKWVAKDGSVKRVREAKQIQGLGVVTRVDEHYGQFGFIQSDQGNVFFNANVVRPETTDASKVLKKGQTVRFIAVDQPDNKCPWRATLVSSKNYKPPKVAVESKPPSLNSSTNNNLELHRPRSNSSAGSGGNGCMPSPGCGGFVSVADNNSSRHSSRPCSPTDLASSSAGFSMSRGSPAMWQPHIVPVLGFQQASYEKSRPLDALIARPSSARLNQNLYQTDNTMVEGNVDQRIQATTMADLCSNFLKSVREDRSFESESLKLRDYAHKLLRISAEQCPVCSQL